MSITRKIIKVFLASPSDLDAERVLAKSEVDDLNRLIADYFGYQVELVGWETSIARSGRPQANINAELDQCELVIGVLDKRWGSPPDTNGKYTSGFEEEFERSVARQKKEGVPEISLLFKDIPDEAKRDPGEQLKKVLDFRARIIEEKRHLFKTFSHDVTFIREFRACVFDYVKRASASDIARANTNETRAPTKAESEASEDTSKQKTSLTTNGADFLQKFIAKSEGDPAQPVITPAEVARVRLLAGAVVQQGNDQKILGAHDANILFKERENFVFGNQELWALFDCGLDYANGENVPVWGWLKSIKEIDPHALQNATWFGPKERRVGALTLIRLMAVPVIDVGQLKREEYILGWLDADASDEIKIAALLYLGDYGLSEDATLIETIIGSANSRINNSAIEAIIRIKRRESRNAAVRSLYVFKPTTISEKIARDAFGDGSGISTPTLREGLDHPSGSVRQVVVSLLALRNEITPDVAVKLINDSEALIRFCGLVALEKDGKKYSQDEAKNILIKPKSVLGGFGGFFGGAKDEEGEKYFEQFKAYVLETLNEKELKSQVETEISPFNLDSAFLYADRYFRSRASWLRAAVDNRFLAEFNKGVERLKTIFSGSSESTVKDAQDLKDFLSKKHTRSGLDILCKKSESQDLGRVRLALTDEAIPYSAMDVLYLTKHGEWQDIPSIIAAVEKQEAGGLLSFNRKNKDYQLGAKCILAIADKRFEELIALPMSSDLLALVLQYAYEARFRELSDVTIGNLFSSTSDYVRKATVLKCIRVLPKNRLTKLAADYRMRESNYYNITHWLDMGVSLRKDEAAAIAGRALDQMRE